MLSAQFNEKTAVWQCIVDIKRKNDHSYIKNNTDKIKQWKKFGTETLKIQN